MASRIRLELIPDPASGEREKHWALRADGRDVGVLTGVRVGDEVHLTVAVDDDGRERGVVRGALGRLLGSAPWGSAVQYVLSSASDSAIDERTASDLGFQPIHASDAHAGWYRAAPPPKPRRDDVTRFLDRDGRIDRYPHRAQERRQLLAWVMDRAIPCARVLSERDVNELLEPYAPGGDVAVLRRYLVDDSLLERTASGAQYRRIV